MSEISRKDEAGATREDRFLISDLLEMLAQYMEHEHVREVYRAYLFGAQAHEGQIRMSGEPYIYHPIAVARILAQMHMDVKSIVASGRDLIFSFEKDAKRKASSLFKGISGKIRVSDPETVYLRLPENYFEPKTLITILRKILAEKR